jgi:uncharacterized protein (TIGR00369 family)
MSRASKTRCHVRVLMRRFAEDFRMDADIATLRAFFAGAPFMAHLGVEPADGSPGRVVTQLALQAHHLQHSGVVHAGVMGALADHTMGAAAQTMTGLMILTAEFKLSLLRAARGAQLQCIGTVIKPGRLVMFTEAEVFALDGAARTLVAKASATMAVTER